MGLADLREKRGFKLKRPEGRGSYLGLWGRPFPGLWGSRLLRSFSSRPATSSVVLARQAGVKATSPFRRDTSPHSGGLRGAGLSIPPSPKGEGDISPHSQGNPAKTLGGLMSWWGWECAPPLPPNHTPPPPPRPTAPTAPLLGVRPPLPTRETAPSSRVQL